MFVLVYVFDMVVADEAVFAPGSREGPARAPTGKAGCTAQVCARSGGQPTGPGGVCSRRLHAGWRTGSTATVLTCSSIVHVKLVYFSG